MGVQGPGPAVSVYIEELEGALALRVRMLRGELSASSSIIAVGGLLSCEAQRGGRPTLNGPEAATGEARTEARRQVGA
jgi:hypothetical protein